jgi:hypothetical protein
MVFGGFGPWARVLFISVSGADMGLAWFVIVGGVLAGAMLILWNQRQQPRLWWPLGLMMVAGIVGVAAVAWHAGDIFGTQGDSSDDTFGTQNGGAGADDIFGNVDWVQPGWGIIMAGVASGSLIVAAFLSWLSAGKVEVVSGSPYVDSADSAGPQTILDDTPPA